jgi:hypothetical protein
MRNKISLFNEILLSFFLALIIIAFTRIFERPLSYNNGLGWDGEVYYNVASQVSHHQALENEAPFVYRFGIPFLVGILSPQDLISGFRLVNLIGSFVSIVLLVILLRKYIAKGVVRLILIFFFVSQWMGPLRTTLFYPTHIEPWSNTTILLQFIFLSQLNKNNSKFYLVAFGVTSFFGVFIRESTILVPFSYFLSRAVENLTAQENKVQQNIQVWLLIAIPLLGGVGGLFATHLIATATSQYAMFGAIIFFAYEKPLLSYLLGYFVTFGPIMAIFYPARSVIKDFLTTHRSEWYYLLVTLPLAWIIGSDTDRFLYWVMPVWYILCGLALEYLWPILTKSRVLLIALLFAQGLSQRSFLPIPDYAPEKIEYRIPLLTVICDDNCLLDLPSYHAWTGPGANAAMCSRPYCYLSGYIFPFKFFLLLENIFVMLLLSLGVLNAQKRRLILSNESL